MMNKITYIEAWVLFNPLQYMEGKAGFKDITLKTIICVLPFFGEIFPSQTDDNVYFPPVGN